MKGRQPETKIGGSRVHFQSTLWTRVLKAKRSDSLDRQEALSLLIQEYWKPLYFYVRKSGFDIEKSKDLTQGFFTAFLEKDFLKSVEREKGRFRSFLLAALKNFLSDQLDREKALKRGGGKALLALNYDNAEEEYSSNLQSLDSPEKLFQKKWALELMASALQRVKQEYTDSGKLVQFETLKEFMTGGDPKSYSEYSKKLGLTESVLRKFVYGMRSKFRESIFMEIRSYTQNRQEAEQELLELFASFS